MADLRTLYPEISPHHTGFIPVDHGHQIYYEQCGNPHGIPIVMLHGGPGGCIFNFFRQLFNPDSYHITLFDQRGCGKSTPFASTEHNQTSDLVSDIEALRTHLDIEKWAVYGYSWGTTLALSYVTTHPDKVTGMVLGGTFLGRTQEIKDFLQPDGTGAARFPEAYQNYLSPLREDEKKNPFQSYIDIFNSNKPDDVARHDACFDQWHTWETVLTRGEYPLPHDVVAEIEDDVRTGIAKSIALLETHYIGQDCFIDSASILQKLNRLDHIPCYIYHGQDDYVCDTQTSIDVHHAWSQSELEIVPKGLHRIKSPATLDATIRTLDRMAHTLK